MEVDLGRLIDALPGLVWTTTPDRASDFVNQRLREYTGLSLDEVRERGWKSAIHPEDMARAQACWDASAAHGAEGHVEARLRRFDGEYRRFEIKTSPLIDTAGRIIGWCGINTDIEDRRRSEEALLAQARRFQIILDGLPAIAALFTPEGRIQYCNRQMLNYLDATFEQVQSQASAYNFHPDDREEVLAEWAASVRSGEPFDREARLQRADGVFRWHRTRVIPLRNDAGEIEVWYGLSIDIEDTKLAEAEAREHQRRFQQVIDNMPAIVALFAADGPITFANRRMLEFHGQTLEQFQAGEAGYTFHADDRSEVLRRYGAAVQTGEPFACDVRLLRSDGAYRWHVVHGFPLRDAQGRVQLWCGMFRDIDDARRAEAELRQAYRQLTEAQRLSRTGSFTVDVAADDHNWSEELYPIFEFEPGSPISFEKVRAAVHPDDLAQFDGGFARAVAGAAGFDGHFRIVTAGGRLKYLHCVAHLIDQKDGRPVFVGALQDVTEARLGEEALKASEAELKRANRYLTGAQRLSRTGSFTWDAERDEHSWSDENLRIWELDRETLTGEAVLGAIHPEDRPAFEAVHARALATGGDYELFYRIVTGSGAVKHLHTVGERQPEVTDRFLFIGATQDVTESRLAEEALSRARAQLDHVTRVTALSALTASIAHEVAQPLAGIITNASTCLRLLAADPPNVDGARTTAERTIRDGNRASDVIQRLRALFARKPPGVEPVDLNDALREVLTLSASDLQRRQVVLHRDFDETLPPVRGDRVQLQQVILNLVLNAADAMNGVDDRPRDLWLATARDGAGQVTLTVRDAGIGLEPEVFERLFDPFFTTKAAGMGIGLSISRSIIQSHDGRLWAAANADGPGAAFAFSIPAWAEPAPEAAAAGLVPALEHD